MSFRPSRPLGLPFFILAASAICLLTPAVRAEESAVVTTKDRIGKLAGNRYSVPTNQILTPAGLQVELPGLRPQAIALSPDGRLLVTSGKTAELIVLDAKTGKIAQKVPFPGKTAAAPEKPGADTAGAQSEEKAGEVAGTQVKPDSGAQLSMTGLAFSPDGSRIYLSNVNGDIKVFAVARDGSVTGLRSIAVPDANVSKRKNEAPTGIAVSPDGQRIYVALNLTNRLLEIDAESGKEIRHWDVGVAPFDVTIAAGKAYVSNWGGRRAGKADLVGPAGRGTTVRVDPVRHIASEGSVSVINLKSGAVEHEIMVELHASALATAPNERYVVVANAGSDTLSVIDTKNDQVVEKIWARANAGDLFGAMPNAVTFDKGGKHLYVCNGTQNAVAVIKFEPEDKESKLLGLIPVGWFPGAIVHDPVHKQLCVANIKGIGSQKVLKPGDKPKHNSKDYYGTLSLVPIPAEKDLAAYTRAADVNMRRGAIDSVLLPPRPEAAPVPVPERTGEPSVFKHVVYIIKENRTYDQILGDVKSGNGDASLCTFGEKFTPNQHKLVREFVLLDNTYCSGIQSSDGHQWTDSSISNEYVERQHASWPRSYPNMKTEDALDALAYASSGFLWDQALKHKRTVRNYGEACVTDCGWVDKSKKNKPGWLDYLGDFRSGTRLTRIACKPGIASLRPISKLDSVGWDLNVPDVVRAAEFIKELKGFEEKGGFPQLTILFLPNDHTAGTRAGGPAPGSMVADNDLAMGQVVEALSKSKFWPETCIFAVEDDPQNGWDHVSGYRTTAYVISPYTKRKQTISTQYNQTSIMRTMELILGIPPMNILDASGTPMSDCFTTTADLTPFKSVPNQVPIEDLVPETKKISDAQLRKDVRTSTKLPLAEADKCDEDTLNRILWRAMKGTRVPYPEWAVAKVDDDD